MKRSLATLLTSPTAAAARWLSVPLLAALLLAGGAAAYASGTGSAAAQARHTPLAVADAGRAQPRTVVVRVAHGPVTTQNSQYIDAPPVGPSVGDVRAYYLPLTRPGSSRRIGYLTGTLTTTATSRPRPGMELRTANLVFVLGAAANQLIVGGVSAYAESATALAKKSVVTRPVIGGSGRYAGARGWCVTTHLTNNTWTHVFHLTLDR